MISPCSKLDKFILFLEYWWMSVCDVIKREQESLDFLPILKLNNSIRIPWCYISGVAREYKGPL